MSLHKSISMIFSIFMFYQTSFAACNSEDGTIGYRSGYNTERAAVSYLWEEFGACRTLDQFIRNTHIDFNDDPIDDYYRCRNIGMSDGYNAEIKYILVNICNKPCLKKGIEIGKKLALQYCRLSSREDEPSAEECPSTCTVEAQRACKTTIKEETWRIHSSGEGCEVYNTNSIERFAKKVCKYVES